jgi:hypothetical protein
VLLQDVTQDEWGGYRPDRLRDGHQIGGKVVRPLDSSRRYSVVAGSPPSCALITAAIPNVMNIQNIDDFRLQTARCHPPR